MSGGDEHFLNEVLVPLLDGGNALAASLLGLVLAYGLPLDVADICKSYNTVFNGDKVFNIDLTADVFDGSSSFSSPYFLFISSSSLQIISSTLLPWAGEVSR